MDIKFTCNTFWDHPYLSGLYHNFFKVTLNGFSNNFYIFSIPKLSKSNIVVVETDCFLFHFWLPLAQKWQWVKAATFFNSPVHLEILSHWAEDRTSYRLHRWWPDWEFPRYQPPQDAGGCGKPSGELCCVHARPCKQVSLLDTWLLQVFLLEFTGPFVALHNAYLKRNQRGRWYSWGLWALPELAPPL